MARRKTHVKALFSARAEISFQLHGIFSSPVFQTGLGFSAQAELRPGLNPSPCDCQFDFKWVYFRSWAKISAQAEICYVIRPFDGTYRTKPSSRIYGPKIQTLHYAHT